MNRWLMSFLLTLVPILAFSDSSLSFSPPASDYSIVFLSNIFGVVDGVLHGTGSQIMGTLSSVFNSAVLALGGIVIMYTLMVSTMNTAHEGQMLGQKWSSIWIPIRSTLGLALLMPKASGYCLMQIFVMWVVVQGVGAADKIWGAALGYMNRGGVLIMAQSNPALALGSSLINPGNASPPLPKGVMTILLGEVCMLSLQKELEHKRKEYLNQKQNQTGPCYNMSDPLMYDICNSPVPDFLSTVNFVDAQNTAQTNARTSGQSVSQPFFVEMPSLLNNSGNGQPLPYHQLNGFCGTVKWNQISALSSFTPQTGSPTKVSSSISLTASELETSQMSRAIALQQVYIDMTAVAQTIVNNAPFLQQSTTTNPAATNFSTVSQQQFGVPYTNGSSVCSVASSTCTSWGAAPTEGTSTFSVLFNGTEFLGAMNDYNGIMFPVINMQKQMHESQMNSNARLFINTALMQGWALAGAYFFDLVNLNGNAIKSANEQDTNTGLDHSVPVDVKHYSPTSKSYSMLCDLLGGGTCQGTVLVTATAALNDLVTLINGSSLSTGALTVPSLVENPSREATIGQASSTVYGFINNSLMMSLPGQPGIQALTFTKNSNFKLTAELYTLPTINFSCGNISTFLHSFCFQALLGNLLYNVIIVNVFNAMIAVFQTVIQQMIMSFIQVPMRALAAIFANGVAIVSQPGVNPIIALANMGTMYINFSGNLWMGLMAMALVGSLIPMVGIFVFALMAFVMPLVLSWVGIMCAVGFTTAYYIPLLPYMIFTFGVIAWLMTVIEAMVAAPIVALGITHPEGHDAFGKGEAAIMLLMNVFLRPAMMIIGYISAITLSYVGVWLLNTGFQQAISFIQLQQGAAPSITASQMGLSSYCGKNTNASICTALLSQYQYSAPQNSHTAGLSSNTNSELNSFLLNAIGVPPVVGWFFSLFGGGGGNYGPTTVTQGQQGSGTAGYQNWAGMYAYFFSILIYTTTYLTIVQNAFNLISALPDKVLRWIGGAPESMGAESARWGEEVKGKIGEAGKGTQDAQGQMGKQAAAYGQKAIGAGKKALGGATSEGSTSAEGMDSTADEGDNKE